MNDAQALIALMKDKKGLLKYIMDAMTSSNRNAAGLRSMKERGFSQEGMLDKVIEVTAIQADQIKHLALIALLLVQSDEFDTMVAMAAAKLGGSEMDILGAMIDAKMKRGY